jgi:hypothetical protein
MCVDVVDGPSSFSSSSSTTTTTTHLEASEVNLYLGIGTCCQLEISSCRLQAELRAEQEARRAAEAQRQAAGPPASAIAASAAVQPGSAPGQPQPCKAAGAPWVQRKHESRWRAVVPHLLAAK